MSELSARDYEEVLADHRRLVRELDVALYGDGAAKQASLCDLVGAASKDVRGRAGQIDKLIAAARAAAFEEAAEIMEKVDPRYPTYGGYEIDWTGALTDGIEQIRARAAKERQP